MLYPNTSVRSSVTHKFKHSQQLTEEGKEEEKCTHAYTHTLTERKKRKNEWMKERREEKKKERKQRKTNKQKSRSTLRLSKIFCPKNENLDFDSWTSGFTTTHGFSIRAESQSSSEERIIIIKKERRARWKMKVALFGHAPLILLHSGDAALSLSLTLSRSNLARSRTRDETCQSLGWSKSWPTGSLWRILIKE